MPAYTSVRSVATADREIVLQPIALMSNTGKKLHGVRHFDRQLPIHQIDHIDIQETGHQMSVAAKQLSISRAKDPLMIWAIYFLVMVVILAATLSRHFRIGVTTDTSYFSLVIAGTFLCSFIYSFFIAFRLRREWKGIDRLEGTIKNSAGGDLAAERLALSIMNHGSPDTAKVKIWSTLITPRREIPLGPCRSSRADGHHSA